MPRKKTVSARVKGCARTLGRLGGLATAKKNRAKKRARKR